MSCVIDKKYLTREGWSRVEKSQFAYIELEEEGMHGVAGLISLEAVSKPLVTKCFDHNFTIVDNGYFWMQIAPKDSNWWLTVMLNDQKQIVQYYFDITRSNVIIGKDSYFEDLMLDVVVRPDGRITLLDKDELDQALEQGNITAAEHNLSCKTAQEIQDNLPAKFGQLQQFAERIFEKLLGELPST